MYLIIANHDGVEAFLGGRGLRKVEPSAVEHWRLGTGFADVALAAFGMLMYVPQYKSR
jgi:hypothetical protein